MIEHTTEPYDPRIARYASIAVTMVESFKKAELDPHEINELLCLDNLEGSLVDEGPMFSMLHANFVLSQTKGETQTVILLNDGSIIDYTFNEAKSIYSITGYDANYVVTYRPIF